MKTPTPFRRLALAIIALSALTLPLAAADQAAPPPHWDLSDVPPYKPGLHVFGVIRIFGGTLGPTNPLQGLGSIQNWEDDFVKFQPDAQFSNNFMTSSEGALAGLVCGVADLAPAGDEAQLSDRTFYFNAFHCQPFELNVGTGAATGRGLLWPPVIVVNKENPVQHVTMKQLDGIFGSERTGGWNGLVWSAEYARGPEENIRTWGQMGLTGEWADKPIQTYGYAHSVSFTYFFGGRVMHNSGKWNPNYRMYVEGTANAKQGPEGEKESAVSSVHALEELTKDRYGIAYSALMHTVDYPGVKALPLAAKDGGPYLALTPDNVHSREYPLYRNVVLYANKPPGTVLNPKVKEFLRYILSRDGQQTMTIRGYYPLPAKVLQEELRKLL